MIFVATSSEHLAAAFADAFADAAQRAIAARGRFVVALTGGSTASDLYPSLARLDVAWDHVVFVFGDERLVPPDHADSNFALAKRRLFDALPGGEADARRVRGELSGAEAAAAYTTEIDALGPIDLVHLGVGPDGHVCSLFPGHAVREDVRVVHVSDSPKPPPDRVTLTFRALAEARELHLVATGEGKADAVHRILSAGGAALPAGRALRAAAAATFFVDAASTRGADPSALAVSP